MATTHETRTNIREKGCRFRTEIIGLIATSAVLLTPLFITVSQPDLAVVQMVSVLWVWGDPEYPGVLPGMHILNPSFVWLGVGLASMRFVFVYQLFLCYTGHISIKRTVVAGLFSDIPALVMSLLMRGFLPYSFLLVPSPFPLLLGLILLIVAPPRSDQVRIEQIDEFV